MHGPGTSVYGMNWSPTWPTRPIPVIDTIAKTLRPRRQKAWRTARAAALAAWGPAGIQFQVTEDVPENYPAFDLDRYNTEIGYCKELVVPKAIRLMRSAYIGIGGGAFAWWRKEADPGAIACFTIDLKFWLRTPASKTYIICHEVGHCLGLDHRGPSNDPRGKSVMGAGQLPDAHDLESVRAYYAA